MTPGNRKKIISHLIAFVLSIGITFVSGQDPRILLYAFAINVLFRALTVWTLSRNARSSGSLEWFIRLTTRAPEPGERSRPYLNQYTKEPAGIFTYIFSILTMMFMLGVLLAMGSDPGFLKPQVMLPDLLWATSIALVYLADDLGSRQLVLSMEKSASRNLGYNVSGINFLLASIFVSAAVVLLVNFPLGMITGSLTGKEPQSLHSEWTVYLILASLRSGYDIKMTLHPRASGRRLPG
jgi:hypothetical protein